MEYLILIIFSVALLAKVVQKKDNGEEKEFDIKVPLGDSYSYEVVHIGFQKTETGWRIFSDPGTF